ncbi:hypothetical protein LP316_13345 [Thalassotalea sp. LPB0316]|uniref:hypothetical protein n=1 Tax=Thalassotalea sp. LPB0316 TaxID=2769490 RepID=UPI0018667ACB|nr:hypothetical protein [Thalassotalea sp. LPB0316]QOL25269.1 hypothetical protein LP316_13345 [Thalassotalea sp. LPB0316]
MKNLASTLAILTSLYVHCAFAQGTTIELPLMEDARVFYQDTAKLPYVANFYTRSSQQEIVAFYRDSLGEVTSQETKRGRLTLHFANADVQYRVVISQQNNMRQVDIIAQ